MSVLASSIRIGLGSGLLLGTAAAWADQVVATAASEDFDVIEADFDLARKPAAKRIFRLDIEQPHQTEAGISAEEARRFRDRRLKEAIPRHWTYKPYEDGPSLEFGGLGAGRKKTPKLAHMAVGWDF